LGLVVVGRKPIHAEQFDEGTTTRILPLEYGAFALRSHEPVHF
jgi:hypothetical protein